MTNIFDIHEKTKVSLRTLRKLEKAGFLHVGKDKDPMLTRIRANIHKGNPLTVHQQVHLLKNRDLIVKLGDHEIRALDVLRLLGDVERDAAPWREIGMLVDGAASKDRAAVTAVAEWLADYILTSPHFGSQAVRDHAFVASRLIWNAPENVLEFVAGRITACMWQCRNHAALKEFWFVNDAGQTRYQRPKNYSRKMLDL